MDADKRGTILYIGGFELPDKNAAAQRVLANAKLFREIGYNTVLLGVAKDIESHTAVEATQIKADGFSMYSVPYPKSAGQWWNYLTDAKKTISFAKTLPDLRAIICYNYPSVALEKIRKYCLKTGIKCFADVTEWYSGLGRSLPVKVLKGLDTFCRMRVVQKRMDGLIVISRYLQNYYGQCRNVVYIPPLTDFEPREEAERVIRRDSELHLVYAGSPGLKDRIDLLIEALPKVKRKVCLDVIGIDRDAYLSLHPEHRDGGLLTQNIAFHGRLSHAETVSRIKAASLSCFFRYDDRVTRAGFPTKFSEAVSLGTPVFTNRSSNVDEYMRGGTNGILLDTLSIERIAEALENDDMEFVVDTQVFNYHNYHAEAASLMKG